MSIADILLAVVCVAAVLAVFVVMLGVLMARTEGEP